jgi:hypothetical protein
MELANRRGVRSIQHDLANKNSDCAFVSHVSPRIWVRTPMRRWTSIQPPRPSLGSSCHTRCVPPHRTVSRWLKFLQIYPSHSIRFFLRLSQNIIPSNASPIGKQRIPQFTRLPFSFGSFLCKPAVGNPPFWITVILQTSFYIIDDIFIISKM